MICKYCRHEFSVDVDTLGQELHCPNCSSTVLISDKNIICKCPFCQTQLSVEMWMIGTTVPCPVCEKDVKLSLDAATGCDIFADASAETTTGLTLKPGTDFGKYKIERCLGIGGMGEVYLATHSFLGTSCAIKLLKKDVTVREEDKQRLLREARLASSIHHQNLIAVLDADIDPATGMLYIVMEYVDGISIDQILTNGPMQEERVLQIIRQVAEALQAAAEMHIVHRDIKPANIMLSSKGKVKLADLGIAKAESDSSMTLTMDNAILGTPHYASPEQLRSSHKVDVRADIYSLGASMYHMLSGQYPFPGDTVFSIMAQVLEQEPKPLQKLAEVSTPTAQLISEMMAKNPDARPSDMTELIARIDRILQFQSRQTMPQTIQLTNTPKAAAAPLTTTPATPRGTAQKLELKPRGGSKPALQELKKTPVKPATKPAIAASKTGKITKSAATVKTTPAPAKQQPPQKQKNSSSKKILLPLLACGILAVAAGVAYFIFSVRKTAEKEEAHAEKIENMLDMLEVVEINPESIPDIRQFQLHGRLNFAEKKAQKLALISNPDAIQTAQKQFYNDLCARLKKDLQFQKKFRQSPLRKAAGTLCGEDGEDFLAESAQFLTDPPDNDPQSARHAEFYRLLKDYAVKCQSEETFRNAPGGIAHKDQLQSRLTGLDPLILVQSMLLFCHAQSEENISEQTMLQLIQDLNPNFCYSKFPASALELPATVLVSLLSRCWDEVDGVSYKKSNLIAELSRTGLPPRPEVITALLQAGCSADLPNSQGCTPLHWAMKQKSAAAVQALLYAAPDLTVTLEKKGIAAWGMANDVPEEILHLLYNAGVSKPANTPEQLSSENDSMQADEPRAATAQAVSIQETNENEMPEPPPVIVAPFVPAKTSALEKPVSSKITEAAVKKAEQFTLLGRIKYVNEKLVAVQMDKSSHGANYYNTQALQFYTELHKRLSQELQNRENAEKSNIQQVSGRLCAEGRALTDTMQTLLNNDNRWAEYYQTLKSYALQCQNEQQYTVSPNAKKLLEDQLAKLQQDIRTGRNQFDPLVILQAFLLFIYNDEGITAQTMLKMLEDAAPDFSYSKFPPEALELPEPVIIALLAKCWDEVDGTSYGKSNLITELSRSNQGGRHNVISALLTAGCNIDTPDTKGLYPLHWAIRNSSFLRHLLMIAPDMKIKIGGKGIIEWGMDEEMLYSTARRLIHAGAPLPNIPEDDYPPNYRALIHLRPAGK